jgi:hypothetical protein
MVLINEEMSNFLNAGNVKIGEIYKIVSAKLENSSFTGKPVLVVTFEGGAKHSFGKQKLQPITKMYGNNTDTWVGRSLKVSAIVPTSKGMSVIFDPVPIV